MDMKIVNKMSRAELEEEKVKFEEQIPHLENVISIIEKRMKENEDSKVLGEKPRFDPKKLEKDLAEAKELKFESEKFLRLFPQLKNNAEAKARTALQKERMDKFLAALVRVIQAEMKGEEFDDKDIGLIKNIKTQGNVIRFLNKIRLTR